MRLDWFTSLVIEVIRRAGIEASITQHKAVEPDHLMRIRKRITKNPRLVDEMPEEFGRYKLYRAIDMKLSRRTNRVLKGTVKEAIKS